MSPCLDMLLLQAAVRAAVGPRGSTCFGAAALHASCKVERLPHSHVRDVVVHLCQPDSQPESGSIQRDSLGMQN